MRRICAWCKKDLGETPGGRDRGTITHGICEECALHLNARMGMKLREFLDGIDVPILLVDSEGKILTANEAAGEIFKKKPDQIEGVMCGVVFECRNSMQPEGCGNTVHCSGCAIRRAVMDTSRTGESHMQIPAYLNQQNQNLDVTISTEKVGEAVLLWVDGIEPRAEE